jgi:hypothetical protein
MSTDAGQARYNVQQKCKNKESGEVKQSSRVAPPPHTVFNLKNHTVQL